MSNKVSVSALLASDWPFSFAVGSNGEDEPFDGSCPCAIIHGDGFTVETHCWRSGCEHGCAFSGIHVSGTIDAATKMRIAEHVRDNNGWTGVTEWGIVIL